MAWRRCIDLVLNHYKYRLIFDLKNTFIEKDLPMQCCQTNVVGCTSFDTLNNRLKELTINIWEVAIIGYLLAGNSNTLLTLTIVYIYF